jgi:CheY-like chemotaxis protein
VSSVSEALGEIRRRKYDLVITMPFLRGINAFEIGCEIKKINPALPVILIAHNLQAVQRPQKKEYLRGIDNIFLWTSGAELLVALVKNVEDHINVSADTAKAMVRVIIYVEDSPADRSFFLPLIYKEVVSQTQAVLNESLNEKHRLLRMRARPKVLLATSYEEALSLYETYKPFVFCILSDARFCREGQIDPEAGLKLLSYARGQIPDLPLLLLSRESENREKAALVPAVFVDKLSNSIKDELHAFFLEHLGFGDFVFRTPDGFEIGRAGTIGDFERMLRLIPDESLLYHAGRNHFSTWIMARAEVAMARRLHKEAVNNVSNVSEVRQDLIDKIHSLRRMRQKGVVVKFSPQRYDPRVVDFVKIGEGPLGGKARGLAFMWARLQNEHAADSLLIDTLVTIPKTCVISANGFETFVAENRLAFSGEMSDEEIEARFLRAHLPDWLVQDLKIFLAKCQFPLSVRSSSLLEDGLYKPFAGLYRTYFLPNNSPDPMRRLGELESAIKLIYASTWFAGPQAFARSAGGNRSDVMAIVIQQVVGQNYGGFWYPAISGVAQSHNYYPIFDMKAEEGIAHIALGLGKTVVEGEKSLRFSPSYPDKLIQFSSVEDVLAHGQRQFYALDVSENSEFVRRNSNLVLRSVEDATREYPIQALSSTYIASEDRIRDGFMPGIHIMTFAPILKYDIFPMARILTELLEFGKEGMGCEVEIEFAIDLGEDPEEAAFYLLQMRPMVTGSESSDVQIEDDEIDEALCYSQKSLGHGRFSDFHDIIFVRPDAFDPGKTVEIAGEISVLNRKLEKESRRYILIGPGRWGSADRWLGIPVQWRDISAVGVMVEIRNKILQAEPSQGSHFFQNITSLGIPYLTITEKNGARQSSTTAMEKRKDSIHWHRLEQSGIMENMKFITHIRSEKPFTVKCNGRKSESIIQSAG